MGPDAEVPEVDGRERPSEDTILAAIVLAVVSALLIVTLPLK